MLHLCSIYVMLQTQQLTTWGGATGFMLAILAIAVLAIFEKFKEENSLESMKVGSSSLLFKPTWML